MAIHVVNIQLVKVNQDGTIVTGKETTIANMLHYETQHRVASNPNVPNSANYPTIEDYLIAEDAAGFVLVHMDQYLIVTQS